jgi:hypothetical protein
MMKRLSRRQWLELSALGGIAVGVQACNRAQPTPTPAGVAGGAAAPPVARPFHVKLAIEGLAVVHREMDGNRLAHFRLAAVNPTANPKLGLPPHVPALGIPNSILANWTVTPLMATLDYTYWSIAGWRAGWEVTAKTPQGVKTFKVGQATDVQENAIAVTANDCDDVRAKWINSRMIPALTEFVPSGNPNESPLIADWHISQYVSGYLDLPFGSLEDAQLDVTPLEEFDNKVWEFSTDPSVAGTKTRAFKSVARLLLRDVQSAKIVTQAGAIELTDVPKKGYDPRVMPIRFSNLGIGMHHQMRIPYDFKAYYDLLKSPPPEAERIFPTKVAKSCATTIECQCCPPVST